MRRPKTIWILVTSALLCGCGPDVKKLADENDRLRVQILDLGKQVDRLNRRNAELEGELSRFSTAPDSLPPAIRANTPQVAEIAIGRLSHAKDADGDGRADTLIVYVDPIDGRGRFLQLVGELSVNAALLPADTDALPIGRTHLDAGALRDAYRGGLIGRAHYTVTVPIQLPEGVAEDECVVRAVYVDGATRLRHADERGISLRPR